MSTLGEIRKTGFRISIHCQTWTNGLACVHFTEPGIEQLIQYLGVDFDIYARRAEFLSRFICERCGGRQASMRVVPPFGDGLMDGAGGAHGYSSMPSDEERRQRAEAFEAEFRGRGGRTNAEIAAYWRVQRKNQALAEQGKGPGFIGPPNPWAHRKRGH
jgi:hypothetical protein